MQRGNVFLVRTDPALHFTDAIAANGGIETENIPLPDAIGAGGHCRSILRHLVVFSTENLSWDVVLFGKKTFHLAPLSEVNFLTSFRLTASTGVRFWPNGPFIYQAPNIDLPYADHDFDDRTLPPEERHGGILHLMLINRSVTPKSADAAGALTVLLYMEPTYG